jgi:hypothetical protein
MLLPSIFRAALRRAGLALVVAAVPVTLVACEGEEGRTRKRIAGAYVRELDGGAKGQWHVRQALTLTPDGRWLRTTRLDLARGSEDSPPDSGTYRVQGVKLALRSLVQPGGAPFRFTINGDTLFSANAAPVHALTGYDIGEEVFVRAR